MRILLLFIVLCLHATIQAQYVDVKERKAGSNRPLAEFATNKDVLWNFDWKFQLVTKENKDNHFASPKLDDSAWRSINLPHDFQWEQPWSKNAGGARGFKPMCEGWYRKSFVADKSWEGLNVKLDFGGIIYYGDVYINGEKVVSTDYGYVGLEADLTKHLKFGEKNVVAVYASTGPKKGSRWYTGAGLFRDVRLILQNPTHIARHGVYIVSEVDANSSTNRATVSIQVEVDGWQKQKNVSIRTRVSDANGNVVGTAEGTMPKHTKQTSTEVKLPIINVNNANLWDIDNPYLYNADVVVEADGMVVDSLREQFGIRKIEFSPQFGFKLNGKKIFLQGNSGHHDMGALGAAAFDSGIERMMKQMKEFGFNCIRCSHNPYSDSFARIADRVGLLVVDELSDKWSDKDYWGGRQPFTNIWPGLITEWIKRDRNRPSIILWSLGNELQIREGWAGYKGLNDWGVTMYRVMDQVVKRWDNTRKTTVAMFPARAGAIDRKTAGFNDYLVPPELACATEVASFNYQSDKYNDYLKHAPHLTIFQSEAESYTWLQPYYNMDRNRMVGMAYWGAIEYWGESNGWPKKGWNYSFFNHTLQPYPQAYLLKSAFVEKEPIVRLGVQDVQGSETVNWNDVNVGKTAVFDHWNFADGSKQQVYTFTNAHSVELLVNGKSIGTKLNNGEKNLRNVILWKDVPYSKGSLTAIARNEEGCEVARHEMQTASKATKLAVTPEKTEWKADGMDLLYLNVSALDRKGRLSPLCNDSLTVIVEGPATLLALDNGDHYTDDLFYGINKKSMKDGRMQVILRSKYGETGMVVVRLSTPAMKKTFKFLVKE